MAKRVMQLVSTKEPFDDDSVAIPSYSCGGIFTPNHPGLGQPNLMQAEMNLERIENHLKRINGILKAVGTLLPNLPDEVNSLLWAAYKLNEDQTMLGHLRAALCLNRREGEQ